MSRDHPSDNARKGAASWFQKGLDALAMAHTADYQSEYRSDHEDAVAAFDRAVNLDPDHAEAWFLKGVALATLERHEEALSAAEQVVRLRPSDHDAWLHKAVALDQLGRHQSALAALERVLELRPHHQEAAFRRAETLTALQRREEALVAWQDVVRAPPHENDVADDTICHHGYFYAFIGLKRLTARFRLGDALARVGRRDDALAAYREAIHLGAAHLHGPLALPGFHDALRDFEEARQAYVASVQEGPPDAAAWLRAGDAFLSARRAEDARRAFEAAARLRPDDVEAWYGKAETLLQVGQRDAAIEAFRHALALNPDFGPARTRLQVVLGQTPDGSSGI